jgi:hypothetical protein
LPQLGVTCGVLETAKTTSDERSNSIVLAGQTIDADYVDLNRGLVNEDSSVPESPSEVFRCAVENVGEKPVGGGVVIVEAQSLPFHPSFSMKNILRPDDVLRASDRHDLSLPFHPLLPGERESALILNYGTRKVFFHFNGVASIFSAHAGGIYEDSVFVNSPMHGDFVLHGVTNCSMSPRRAGTGMLLVREKCYNLSKHFGAFPEQHVRYLTGPKHVKDTPLLQALLYGLGSWFNDMGYKVSQK